MKLIWLVSFEKPLFFLLQIMLDYKINFIGSRIRYILWRPALLLHVSWCTIWRDSVGSLHFGNAWIVIPSYGTCVTGGQHYILIPLWTTFKINWLWI